MITAKVFAILMTLLALILGGLSGYQYFQSTERDETVAALRGDLADLTRSNRDLENELTRLRSERDELAAQAEDLESDQSAAAETAAELNTQLTEVTAERDDLDASLIEMTTARDELRAELRQQQEETEDLAAELEAVQDVLTTAESERDDLVAERDALQDELTAARSERDDVMTERDNLQDELAAARSERDDVMTERDNLQDELLSVQSERDDVVAERNSLQDELAAAREAHEALSAEHADLQGANDRLLTELERTRAQLSGREETMEELEARLDREQSALDELQTRLNLAEVERRELIEQRQDGQTLIQLPERILFGTGSAGLSDDAVDALREVALAVESFPDYTLSVIGHSDRRPIGPTLQSVYPSNWELSAARASATVRALAELGVSEDRMKASGVAATQPLVEEVDDASRQQNRRIEIVLQPPLRVENLQEASQQ